MWVGVCVRVDTGEKRQFSKKRNLSTVSEVHKQWGNEKRECMCLSLSLRFSLGTIKDDEHEGSPSLHIAFLLRKTGDFTSVKLNRERKNLY